MAKATLAVSLLFAITLVSGCSSSFTPVVEAHTLPKIEPQPSAFVRPAAFIGDSITNNWDFIQTMPGWWFVKDGLPGFNIKQITAAFPSIIPYRPRIVMILAGTNDIQQRRTPEEIMADLTVLIAQVRGANAIPVLCTIPPMRDSDATLNPTIIAANYLIKDFARQNGYVLADYYSVLVDPATGQLADKYSRLDSPGVFNPVHPGPPGYVAISPVALDAIRLSLRINSDSQTGAQPTSPN